MTRRTVSLLAALGLTLASGSALAKTYDCQMAVPLALYRNGTSASLRSIGFPDLAKETWAFQVRISPGKKGEPDMASVVWPSNPIQIAGEFPVLPTAKGAIAFSAYGLNGCMFTELACLATVQIVDQDASKAKIVVLPTALWSDPAADKRDPFVAIVEGTCSWKDS